MGVRLIFILLCSLILISKDIYLKAQSIKDKSAKSAKDSDSEFYIISNQDKYSAGDTVWLKVYYLNEDILKVHGKKIVALDLINEKGKSLMNLMFRLEKGIGYNQFVLPDYLTPGLYNIVISSFRPTEKDQHSLSFKAIEVVSHFSLQTHEVTETEIKPSLDDTDKQNEIKVEIKAPNKFFPREKVQVEFSLKDDFEKPVFGEFSVRVIKASLFGMNINNSMEIRKLKKIKTGMNSDGLKNGSQSDNLEINGIAYYGNSQMPVQDSTEILFYLQKQKMRYKILTNEKGEFRLKVIDFYDLDEIFYMGQYKNQNIPDLKIILKSRMVLNFPIPEAIPETDQLDSYGIYASNVKKIKKSYSFYTKSSNQELKKEKVVQTLPTRMGEADAVINVNDYIDFSTMKEFIKAVIRPLYYIRTGDKESVRVDIFYSGAAEKDPLYIIDGIATFNTSFFLALDPSDLLTIKVFQDPKKLIHFGIMGKNGIVIAETKSGDVREPLDDSSKLIRGLSKPLGFNTPIYSSSQNIKIPDFRSTLYWNPYTETDINGKSQIEFYCSDDLGKYLILIEGFSAEGKHFYAIEEFVIDLLK